MYKNTMDLLNIVYSQLPKGIADKIELYVETDAYFMRPVAVVKLANGQVYRADLEAMEFEGMTLYTKLPDTFLTQLCVMV